MGTTIVSTTNANGHISYERSTDIPDDKLLALHDTIAMLKLKYGNR